METYRNLIEGDLNPKVQLELEKLNVTSSQINEFENKLQDLRNSFNETLSKCTSTLLEMSNKIGPEISRARSYYDYKWSYIDMERESKMAASRYEIACADLNDAIAAVNKTESLAKETLRLDDSMMEVLNKAIFKVNLAKKEKVEAHNEHQWCLSKYMDLERKIRKLEKKNKNDIKKSSDYFVFTKNMDDKLKEDKLNIEVYEEKIKICKTLYNNSLTRLEEISNQIHEERKHNESLGPRGEGVGAEIFDSNVVDCIDELKKINCSSVEENSLCKESPVHIDWSLGSRTPVPSTSSLRDNIYYRNIRQSRLSSSTPIVDGLMKAMLYNHKITLPHDSNNQFSFTPLSDYQQMRNEPNSVSSASSNIMTQNTFVDAYHRDEL